MTDPESVYRVKLELPLFASSAPVSGNGAEGGDSALKDTQREGQHSPSLVADENWINAAHSHAPTRRGMPETSYKAAASVSLVNLGRTKERIISILRNQGPMTDEQIAAYFERFVEFTVSPSGLRTRRSWLVDHGLVCDSGQRAQTQSGRESIVWRIK